MDSQTLKILVTGIENVGKTSILYSLEKKYSLLGTLSPTKGIDRTSFSIFGYQVSAWDLGGQESYRKGYLQKNIFFEEADLLIYVIDVIDDKNYDISLDYFQKILKIFSEIKQTPQILIFLNKIDPDIKNKPQIRKNIKLLLDMFSASNSEGFNFEFFETSIFDEWSLVNAFSTGLRKLSNKTEILSNSLADLAKKIMANAMILMNQNGYLLAEYAIDELSAFLCQSISTQSLYMYLLMKEKNITPEKITVDLKDGSIVFCEVTITDEHFFIISYSKVSRTLELFNEYFPKFADQTKDIFKVFFK
ncbi:MAG TPA: ADP-ribosylation factor-like protein [Candidatus Deferrimicrobium sp.]|nr:ADP-ribosylation factor-like protein [Candidatus Deferrimicrobium sp.]